MAAPPRHGSDPCTATHSGRHHPQTFDERCPHETFHPCRAGLCRVRLCSVCGERLQPRESTATLRADLDANPPLVLDIRGKAYGEGHIPGVGLLWRFRGPKDNPGQLVPEDQLEATLRGLGVTFDRRRGHEGDTDSDFGAAARVYWTLKSSGVSQLAI
ncbi:MAG: hypothetical protein R3D61_05450 [Defluviimonas denitrificans]